MKNLIILMGTVLLGCILFQMMAGDQPGSLKSTAKEIMLHSISIYTAQEGDVR